MVWWLCFSFVFIKLVFVERLVWGCRTRQRCHRWWCVGHLGVMLDCCGWCYLFIFFIGKENENWGEKRKRKGKILRWENTGKYMGFFIFLVGKIKTFGHIYMNELNFVTHIFIHTIPKVTQIMTWSHGYWAQLQLFLGWV